MKAGLFFSNRSARIALVVLFDATLAACLALPGVAADAGMRIPILAALGALVAWQLGLAAACCRGRWPALEIIARPRFVHVLQFSCQSLVMLYWGLYYRDVYHHYYEVFIQLAFGYVLDVTLAWMLKRQWYFGFGVFPIVISTNLFIWFEHGTFWIQLALIATGILSKTFLTWKRDGVRTHIFNPSGLPLATVALILLVTGNTRLGRGVDFPVSYEFAPHIYEVIFIVGLILNLQVRTVLLTGSSVVTAFLLNHLSRLFNGKPFLPLDVPPPDFLGATLLFTDPATTPRSALGKALAGVMYGALTTAIAVFCHWIGQPGYYDKVLAVPFVNLASPWLDRAASKLAPILSSSVGGAARVLRVHAVQVAIWIAFFVWYAPDLQDKQQPLFPPPKWLTPTPEFMHLTATHAVLCREHAGICRPFALGEELSYWLHP